MGNSEDNGEERNYDERFLEQQFDKEYPEGVFLEAVRNCPVASTDNVADEVGCDRSTAYRRLKQLEERGEIGSEDVSRGKVWTRRI